MSTDQSENGGAVQGAGKTKYLRHSKTISGRLDEELVMMDIEQGKYFALNPVATRIWELLENPLTVEDLCTVLMDEYDVEKEQCSKETEAYLAEMTRFGLLSRKAE